MPNGERDVFWGISRERTVFELAYGKKHLDIIVGIRSLPLAKYTKDYGNDPYESQKWCAFLLKANVCNEMNDSYEDESCFSISGGSDYQKCPIYKVLKARDMAQTQ